MIARGNSSVIAGMREIPGVKSDGKYTPEVDGDVIAVRDLASLLGVSPQDIYYRIKIGTIPAFKISNIIRIPTQWVRENTRLGADGLTEIHLRRGGRPPVPPEPSSRVVLSYRITDKVKIRLAAAAKTAGRSMGHEAELRLERSFEQDRVLAKLDLILEHLSCRQLKDMHDAADAAESHA